MPRQDPNNPLRRPYNYRTTHEERREIAKAAINARWARVADRKAATAAARAARLAGYYAEADRQGITDPELREKMASNALAADMARMRAIQMRQQREAAATAPPGEAAS